MSFTELIDISRQFLSGLIKGLGFALLFALPMVVVGWMLHRRRRKYKAAARDPFTEMPLRPPGESLRKKIEELNDQFDTNLTAAAMTGVGAAMYAAALTESGRATGMMWWFLISMVLFSAGYCWVTMSRLLPQLWDHRLGFEGERAVGEVLNRLIADGFHVFHDMPFDGFNIDHVLVGPPGVFAVETKTRRKPAELKGTDKATVVFDGTKLIFPRGNFDTEALAQAERNAATLSKFLSSATGEPTKVNSILTLPGWWIDRRARGNVNVLNPKEIQSSFRRDGAPLSPDRIQRIVHQLTERCRIEKAK